MSRIAGIVRVAGVLVMTAMLPGCSSSSSSSSSSEGGFGSTFSNLLLYNSTTAPAPQGPRAGASLEGAECPSVSIADGGAALRTLTSRSAESGAVASQISISDMARECTENADGSVVVKVGVQGRVLLGPGGSSAKFDTPLRIVLKRGDRVIASRVARVSASLAPGEPQGSFTIVEDGLLVPAGTGEFEIEVGLGGAPTAPTARPRRKPS